MAFFTVSSLFQISILLYILAATASIVFIKKHNICNIISNSVCIAASVTGAASSILKIFAGYARMELPVFKSDIPFITFDIRLDNLSALFLLCLSVLVFCISIYSIGYVSHYYGKRNVGLLNFLYSTFILSMIFVITSGNMVFFFIAWEAMSFLSYFLVIFESEHRENQNAGLLYIIMTHIGTAFLLIGFMIIYSHTKSFDIFTGSEAIPEAAKNIIFILFLIGFGTKAGVIPVHIWLPYAHPAAPSNISALMSGMMIKTAFYGMLRFVFIYLGVQNTWWGIAVIIIGITSAVLGVAYAFVEKNIKKLLAYSSIENIGIIFIGLGIAFIAQAKGNQVVCALAIAASLFHFINHTLFKGSLFLGAGSIHYATHTKNMEELGGLIKRMPVTALLVLCGALSISAVVPFNGFISEWLTYQSIFANIVPGQALLNILSILAVAALAMAGALAIASFVKLFGISFLGLSRSEHAANAREVPVSMNIGIGILTSLCLIIGLFPQIVLKVIDVIVNSIAGVSLIERFQGDFIFTYYPLSIAGNSISPLEILIIIIGIILLSLIIIRIIGGKYIERKYGTWDCGFEALNSRMQYSATGYSKPITIVFRILFRPVRQLKINGDHTYHPDSIEYTATYESIFEKYIYKPTYLMIKRFSSRTKLTIQTGSIHKYLIYIFVALLILMIYNRFM